MLCEEGQQQLLEVITSLCLMQANVVAMLMSATHIVDKLNMAYMSANDHSTITHIPDTPLLVTQSNFEDFLPALEQVEPGPVGVQVTSVTSPQCCSRVIPWKRKGLVFTKLFEQTSELS